MGQKSGFIDELQRTETATVEETASSTVPETAKSALQELWELPDMGSAEDEYDYNDVSDQEETEDIEEEDQEQDENEDQEEEESDEEVTDSDQTEEQEEEGDEEEEGENPAWANKMMEIFPDRNFETVEDYDNAVMEHITNLETGIETRDQAHKDLIDIFKNYPQLAAVVNSLKNGESDRVALVKAGYSPEDFTIEDGDEDAEALVTAKLKQKEARQKEIERQERIQKNIQLSQKHLETFKNTRKVEDKKWDRFLTTMNNAVTSFMEGNVTPEVIEHFWKGLEFDTEKENAKNEGRIMGRNEKIVAEKKKRKGDGLPNLSKGSSAQTSKKLDPFSVGLSKKIESKPIGFLDALSRKN